MINTLVIMSSIMNNTLLPQSVKIPVMLYLGLVLLEGDNVGLMTLLLYLCLHPNVNF